MQMLSPRQVHLDFHTSEWIEGVGAQFDAETFARMAKEAAVSSMTVFARCHHGWLYYDSWRFPERVHPHLANRNLLVEQVRALHAQGIKAPVYITVQWDYYTANRHPEWLIRKPDGAHEGGPFSEPGFYQSLCVNTGYWKFLQEQTLEVIELLGEELDGLFFDIVGIRPCACAACRKEMLEKGLDFGDEAQVRAFAKQSIDRFKQKMSAFVREHNDRCTIFYNAGHVGPCTKESKEAYTHFELESLPSGGWGYLHFPVTARYARKLGKDCIGMTGKFHTSWGDFHSLKNQAALEFEAFRMLSFGFACSIGDQLPPDGRLNAATYRLIGKVYRPFAEREAWARPSTPLVEAAVLTNESPLYEQQMSDSILGAAQLLEELALQFDIIDAEMDFSPYKLLIVPEDVAGSSALSEKLAAFTVAGGRVLSCGRGALDNGAYPACYPARYAGEREAYPDFIVANGLLAEGLEPENEYAIYQQGAVLENAQNAVLFARAPYFPRVGRKFCSHRYTPSAGGEAYPTAAWANGVLLFAHPLFAQYRDCAPGWVKQIVKNALDLLLPERLVRHDGASTVTVSLLDQPEHHRTCAHILSYIPVRKSATIDIVEERTQARDLHLTLRIPRGFTRARLVPEGIPLAVEGERVTVPCVDGYAIVELT